MRYLVGPLLVLMLFLAACGSGSGDVEEKIETNMDKDVGAFEFTTQDNEKFGLEDLKGSYWIADFIFTNCTTVCLPMTTNMSALQDRINEEGMDIQLVSFSVDPDYDSPEVLTEYAAEYNADLSNWTFLTGYDFQTIKELSVKSFMSLLEAPPEDSDQVTHVTSFFLVNPEGKIIKKYGGTTASDMDIIMEDLKQLDLN